MTWADDMPDAYERGLVPALFQPYADDLAERAARLSPGSVLELAAGTGVVTRALRRALPTADITATDLSPAMVERGRANEPTATWQPADALDLPFPDESFDLVCCQFGVMFLPDKAAGFGQARRVVRPGGTVLFNSWASLEECEFDAAVVDATDALFPDNPPSFLRSTPHGYFDADAVAADVAAGGLDVVSIETVAMTSHAESASALAVAFCTGTPVRAELEARGDLQAVTAEVVRRVEGRLGAGPITGRMKALVVEARRAP